MNSYIVAGIVAIFIIFMFTIPNWIVSAHINEKIFWIRGRLDEYLSRELEMTMQKKSQRKSSWGIVFGVACIAFLYFAKNPKTEGDMLELFPVAFAWAIVLSISWYFIDLRLMKDTYEKVLRPIMRWNEMEKTQGKIIDLKREAGHALVIILQTNFGERYFTIPKSIEQGLGTDFFKGLIVRVYCPERIPVVQHIITIDVGGEEAHCYIKDVT